MVRLLILAICSYFQRLKVHGLDLAGTLSFVGLFCCSYLIPEPKIAKFRLQFAPL
jgi:hypothetical protein